MTRYDKPGRGIRSNVMSHCRIFNPRIYTVYGTPVVYICLHETIQPVRPVRISATTGIGHTDSTTTEDADTAIPVINMDDHLSSPWGSEWCGTNSLTLTINWFFHCFRAIRCFHPGGGVELVWRNFWGGQSKVWHCVTEEGRGGQKVPKKVWRNFWMAPYFVI